MPGSVKPWMAPHDADAGADERGDTAPGAEIEIGVRQEEPLGLGGGDIRR